MNVEIGTETPIFLFWEYLLQIFGIFSLQCEPLIGRIDTREGTKSSTSFFNSIFCLFNDDTVLLCISSSDKKTEVLKRCIEEVRYDSIKSYKN